MAITEYKYRKLTKMINDAKVGQGVKNLLKCALRDYRMEHSEPADGQFGYNDETPRCLVGAALHNIDMFNEDERDWEKRASLEFGIKRSTASAIVGGFDSFANCELPNKNSRVEVLSARLASELMYDGQSISDYVRANNY